MFNVTSNNGSVLYDSDLKIFINNYNVNSVGLIVISTNNIYSGIVNVEINNKKYSVNVVNGKGNTTISNLPAGNYIAIAKLTENNIFKNTNKSTSFKVINTKNNKINKDKIYLSLSTVKIKKSAKKLVIKAVLKINSKPVKGVILTFKFKGKTSKIKTNKNGIAKVTYGIKILKKLKVGKKVKYQVKYKNITKTKSVKVKK